MPGPAGAAAVAALTVLLTLPAGAQPMTPMREAPVAAGGVVPGLGHFMARDLRYGTRLRWQSAAAEAAGPRAGGWFVSVEGEATGQRRLTASSLVSGEERGAGVLRGLAGYRLAEFGAEGGLDLLAGPLLGWRTGRVSAGWSVGADLVLPGLLPGLGSAGGQCSPPSCGPTGCRARPGRCRASPMRKRGAVRAGRPRSGCSSACPCGERAVQSTVIAPARTTCAQRARSTAM